MNNKTPFYITTAIAYASGTPHFGNTYEIVLADAVARHKRRAGFDVRLVTGTDEHGQKIESLALSAGVSPQEFVDKTSGEIKRVWDSMGASYDRFIRTTEAGHKTQVQKIFKRLFEQGDIYKSSYDGLYCTPCESFFTESQLESGKCPDCGREVSPAKEDAYFFRMSKYADRLMAHIESHPEFIFPESRKNEMVESFLRPGLSDLCVSRTSFKWGVPVDFDPDHVVYVWIDALTNYISALDFDLDNPTSEDFQKYWFLSENILHIIGKDILRFHTIYWPIILMALGLPLPKTIFGHPWFLFGNDKMSKSKGNIIYTDTLINIFGVDAVRWYMLSEMPFSADGSITYEQFLTKYNADLANTLGNLVTRTISMAEKYSAWSELPAAAPNAEVLAFCAEKAAAARELIDSLRMADACEGVLEIARRLNKYIDETSPWALAKTETTRLELLGVLQTLLGGIAIIADELAPLLPATSERIISLVKTHTAEILFPRLTEADLEAGLN